jgi:indolepyruvate ferredoxin oxidoreductase, alpha subunit
VVKRNGKDADGDRIMMLGNEAIARGAIEAGVQFAAAYPGTPATDILETLAGFSKEHKFHAEWSVNEKVAFEKAMGVSLLNLRAIISMKHAGMNWIADPLSVSVLGGTRGGLVIVTADDPNCHSSANEQDNRFYGMFFKIPVLEPSDPQEAKEMTREAFELSERISLPVILRSVTRVSHSRGDVLMGEITQKARKRVAFEEDPARFYLTTSRSLSRHFWLIQQQEAIKKEVESSPFNQLAHQGEKTVLFTSGIAYTYVKEAIKLLNPTEKVGILKIGIVYPLPALHVKKVLEKVDLVLVVEEGDPFMEMNLKAIASELEKPPRILGKMSGHVRYGGELTIDSVIESISDLLHLSFPTQKNQKNIQEAEKLIPPRTTTFCAGCPHSATFYVLSKIQKDMAKKMKQKVVFLGDIGCYSMGNQPPYKIGDVKYSMGAGIGVAEGIAEFSDHKVIALIGDGTFYHAGFPGLLNAVYNGSNLTLVILDNSITAMTGMQPTPGTGMTAMGVKTTTVRMEEIIKGCGVEYLEVVDSFDIKRLEEKILDSFEHRGVSVVIARNLCAIELKRELQKAGKKPAVYRVNKDLCKKCLLCLKSFSCPAISQSADTILIDESLCLGCGVCQKVCPSEAIELSG